MEELLSIERASKPLGGISKWTIAAWLSKGKLPRAKVGARTITRERDLQELIKRFNPHNLTEPVSK